MSPRAPSPLRESGNGNNGSSSVGMAQVPTLNELERHYFELSEQRRRMSEMLDKTDRLMAGVRRGIDEMQQASTRGGNGNGPGSGTISSTGASPSVPLSSRGERREGMGIWPVTPSDPATRD
ncbi:hypothetical protein EW145_g3940 [Phellinidium pouzarii]|uniref:Uncharacterized protein n=1 Tax=Phellinidium pouzarii TaxID=167371 RepID=A0A4V3XCP1_9AGAM|nr:hypothetical protein EW145_g3940 [Phellinidium pouzarii]